MGSTGQVASCGSLSQIYVLCDGAAGGFLLFCMTEQRGVLVREKLSTSNGRLIERRKWLALGGVRPARCSPAAFDDPPRVNLDGISLLLVGDSLQHYMVLAKLRIFAGAGNVDLITW